MRGPVNRPMNMRRYYNDLTLLEPKNGKVYTPETSCIKGSLFVLRICK